MEEKRELDVYPEQGKCPLCGSKNVSFLSGEVDEAGYSYQCCCDDCDGNWLESYTMVFAGNWNIQDKDGNDYEDLPT